MSKRTITPAQKWQQKRYTALGRVTMCKANLEQLQKYDREIIDSGLYLMLKTVISDLERIEEVIRNFTNPYKGR